MINQNQRNFDRVQQAIQYIQQNFKRQPSLAEVANAVNLSPTHLQKLFSEWAGVSPKKFIQYLSLNYAKDCLKKNNATLLDVTYKTGFSSPSRLHDLFLKIEAMTPGEFKNGGQHLAINYHFYHSPFGQLIAASTAKGICRLSFEVDEISALDSLKQHFPNADIQKQADHFQQQVLQLFDNNLQTTKSTRLHRAGTPFQLKVWEALLTIPFGARTTYGDIAREVGNHKSARAVGTAIGKNPIALLIPCHRVIQSNGQIGGYMWGPTRKAAILGWDAAKLAAD